MNENDTKTVCPYCQPHGEIAPLAVAEQPSGYVHAVPGGDGTIDFFWCAGDERRRAIFDINYCPVCGRKL